MPQRARFLAAVLVTALTCGLMPPAAFAADGTLRGTVTESGSGVPVEGATVQVFCWLVDGSNAGDLCGEARTAGDGSYSLQLAPGTYKVLFDRWPTHAAQYYGGGTDIGDQDSLAVAVADGGTFTGVDAALVPLMAVAGTVTGNRAPASGINVTAYQQSDDTVPSWYPVQGTVTSLDGTYALRLREGTYRVGFADANGPYQAEFFDDAERVEQADDVVVAGDDRSGIDADLALNHPITGTVSVEGVNMPGVAVTAWRWVRDASGASSWDAVKWTTSGAEGRYVLYLPDGIYRVEFKTWQAAYPAVYYDSATSLDFATDVVVAGAEVPNIDAAIRAEDPEAVPAISGTVRVAGAGAPAEDVAVTAWRWNEVADGWGPVRETWTAPDGTYVLRVPEGTYRVGFGHRLGRYEPAFYDGAITVDDAEDVVVTGDDVFDVNALVVENHGSISGTVTADAVEGGPPGAPAGTRVTAWRWNDVTDEWDSVIEVQPGPDGTYLLYVADGIHRVGFEERELGAWQPVYFDRAATIDDADDVVVAGANVANIDGHLAAGFPEPHPGDPWPPAVTLSEGGQDAWGPRVAVDGRGGATAVWYRWDGHHNRVQGTSRAANGPWSTPASLSSAGEDAWDPQVAVGANGHAVVVWRRWTASGYQVQASSRAANGPWSTPASLSSAGEDAWDPQVAVGANGHAVVVWRRWTASGYQVQASSRAAAMAPWSAPVALSSAGGDAWSPQVALGPDGTTAVAWSHSDGGPYRVQATTRSAGGSWSPPAALSAVGADAWDPQVAVGPHGAATAVWHRSDGGRDRVQVALRPPGAAWSSPSTISPEGGDAHDPQVAWGGDGVVTVVWSRWDGSADRVEVASLAPARTWSAPHTLSRAGQGAQAPQVASGGDGRAAVVWHVVDGISEWVQVATRRPDGTWPAPTDLLEPGMRAYGPHLATGPDGTVAVVWERRDGAFDRVQAAVLHPTGRTGGAPNGRR